MTEEEKLAALDPDSREYLRLKQWVTATEQMHRIRHSDYGTEECWVDLWDRHFEWAYWNVTGKWVDGKRESYTMSRVSLWIHSDKPFDYQSPTGEQMDACHDVSVCLFPGCINPDHLFWDTRSNNLKARRWSNKWGKKGL